MRLMLILEFKSLNGVVPAPGGPEEDTSADFKFDWIIKANFKRYDEVKTGKLTD